ncbi:MAG: hypothetical protein ACK4NS_07935 [Saprospiraceae bacterium]
MSKNTEAFDDLIRTRIGGYEAPYEPESWDELQKKMEQIRLQETRFDANAARQIDAAARRIPAADWDALNALMRYRKRLRQHLYAAKTLEAAALLILLFPWLHTHIQTPPHAPTAPPGIEGPVVSRKPGRPDSAPSQPGLAPAAVAPLAPMRLDTLRLVSQHQSDAPDLFDASPMVAGSPGAPSAHPSAPLAFSSLNTLQIHPFATSDPGRPTPVRSKNSRNKPAQLQYVGAMLGAGTQQLQTTRQRISAPIRAAGAIFGVKKGAWGIESGLQYAERHYETLGPLEVFQAQAGRPFMAWQMSDVTLGSVSVPLRVSRRIARLGPIEARMGAGIVAHAHLQKDYMYRVVALPATPQGSGPIQTVTRKQHIGAGILEQGGRLRNNVFVSAEAGLRIEAAVGANGASKIFVEPSWMAGLHSASHGPEPGKLSGLTVQAGVVKYL